MLLIKNGYIVSGENDLVVKDILIKDDVIIKIEDKIDEKCEVIDA